MKKYIKPALFYENFDLTEHVAAGCQIIMESGDPNSCMGDASGLGITDFDFVFANAATCDSEDENDGVYSEYNKEEGYCYYAYEGGLFPPFTSG